MTSDDAQILLSADAKIVWADVAAAALWGYSMGEFREMTIPSIGRASNRSSGQSDALAEAFQRIVEGGAAEAEGEACFSNRAEQKIAVHWRMRALLGEGARTSVLLSFGEAKQPVPENPVTASYRDVFEYAVEGIFRSTAEGQIIEINPALAKMHGYRSPAEFMDAVRNLNTQLYVRPNRRAEFVKVMQEQGFVAGFESEFYRRDGSIIWAAVFARAVRGENRQLLYFEGSMIDVTERKRAEAALLRSEEKYRRLAETTGVIPFEFDVATGVFSYVGPQAEGVFGGRFVSGLPLAAWASMLHPDDIENGMRFAREAEFPAKGELQTEFRVQMADGRLVWIKQIVQRDAGEAQRDELRGFLFEVTEAKKAEEERERSRGQLRELAARTQQVREEERMNIAREIHDELGQGLTLLKIDLAWLSGSLAKTVADEIRKPLEERIGKMEQMIHWTLLTVRRILSALRPPLLDELGLKDAIEFQMGEFSQRVGIRYDLDIAPVGVLPANSSTAVFRIFQEALTNVARHANASRIKVYLREANGHLVMKVQDNGCGISQEKLLHSGNFGLLGMQERAWAIGGELELHASSRSGTTVTLRVPLGEKVPDAE